MNSKLEGLSESGSILGMTQALNDLVGQSLAAGLLLVVFTVSFYRLSSEGYVAAFTASSFTTSILAFILAAGSLIAVEMAFMIAFASVASLAYMYMNQRAY